MTSPFTMGTRRCSGGWLNTELRKASLNKILQLRRGDPLYVMLVYKYVE